MLQFLEHSFLDFLSFTETVNLVSNYRIIGNPTTFPCKTLTPRMIIFNSFLASMGGGAGGRKKRQPRGNRLGSGREGESLLIVDLPSGTGISSWTFHFLHLPSTDPP